MARQIPNKLPRSYFKRAAPAAIPLPNFPPTKSDFFVMGRYNARAAIFGRLWGEDLLNALRYAHQASTMDNWRHFRSQKRLGGGAEKAVAIIVDGSVTRPIQHAKVFGEIVIQEPPSLEELYLAVEWVYSTWYQRAQPFFKSGDYINNLHIFADNDVWVDPRLFINRDYDRLNAAFGNLAKPPFFTVINTMPYAAKEERNKLPGGLAYFTWKQARGAFGAQLALRFRYYTSDHVDVAGFQDTGTEGKRRTKTTGATQSRRTNKRDQARYAEGQPLSFPAINIGPPGAFNSGASPVLLKARRQVMRK